MKTKKIFILLVGLTLLIVNHLAAKADFPLLKGPYLGQKPPGITPEIFAPGIVSAESTQGYPSFTQDGKEFYFHCRRRGGWVYTKRKNNIWQVPAVVPFSIQYGFAEAIVSADGSKLLFCSKHPHKESKNSDDLDLWMMERKEGVWQEPVPLNSALNSNKHEAFPTLAISGNLYFFREYEDKRGCEILVSKYLNGVFTTPEILGPTINTEKHECDPFIDPHERYMIYCVRDREGGFGNNDLYVSFKTEAGIWTKSVNLGPRINNKSEEITPHVSPDGNYLFFSSKQESNYDIYWVDAKIIEDLKPDEIK
jgi:Tol biopolymer transport system component